MSTNKISVIIPIYNVENELDRCINSIVNQTYNDIEIILVDDGSTDKCPKICDEFKMKDSRIVVVHKKNGGLSSARNEGLKIASGDYILYVDSDDYIEKDSCEKLLNEIIKGTDIVCGSCKEIRSEKISFQRHTNIEPGRIYTAKEFAIASIKANEWYAPACFFLYKKDFLLKNNLFFKEGYYFEDMEMLPRLFFSNPKIIYTDYPFYNYVIRENSITNSNISDKKIQSSLNIYKQWKEMFDQVVDREYQSYLYGCLIRYYITNARKLRIKGWKVNSLDFKFAYKYALNVKEKIKVIMFNYFPNLYINL